MAKSTDPHWMEKAFSKHKGALRKTAKKAGLITGGETLGPADLRELARSQNPLTKKRAQAAKNAAMVNARRNR